MHAAPLALEAVSVTGERRRNVRSMRHLLSLRKACPGVVRENVRPGGVDVSFWKAL